MAGNSFKRLLSIAKPVLHDTGIKEAQYAGVGTCFLARYKSSGFLVTARHVLEGKDAESLAVFPNPQSMISVPFNEFIQIAGSDVNDADYADVTVLRIDARRLEMAPGSEMPALNLTQYDAAWGLRKDCEQMLFFGYPTEERTVDYEKYLVKTDQKLIAGKYIGASSAGHCHRMQIEHLGSLGSLDGFSGSPVFIGDPERDPHFCGMVIRGTVLSETATFIDGSVIHEIIRRAH